MASDVLTPPTLTFDEVDIGFSQCGRSFTGVIYHYFDNPITENGIVTRKRCRLTLCERYNMILTRRVTAYLYDEWRDIVHYFWNLPPANSKTRDITRCSLTLFAVRVEKINPEEADPDPTKPDIMFVVDGDVSDDSWIEFKTCCNRICGRKGIRFSKKDAIHHVNGTKKIEIANNANINYLRPKYKYLPLSELFPSGNSNKFNNYLYGYITMTDTVKSCFSGQHHFYKQIRIRDSSLSWDSDDLQIMFFGNNPNEFPNCRESDLIRIHRVEIKYRSEQKAFQAVVQLTQRSISFIVFNGNLTIANNQESVKHSFSENYSFDELVDGYFIKYLKDACRLRQEQTNPDLMNITDNDIMNKVAIPNVLTVNRIPIKLLNEIDENDERLNVVVMIRRRLDIDNDNDMDIDHFSFYWVVWDGSYAPQNAYVAAPVDNGWHSHNIYNDNPQIVGSLVKVLVAPEYETAIQCYQDIAVGQWVMLINVLYDFTKKELVYDRHSQIDAKIDGKTNQDLAKRLDLLYYNIYQQTDVMSNVSRINPHHQYQSYSLIKAILKIKYIDCKYKIRGKCKRYFPRNIEDFTKNNQGLQFGLCIEDSSGSVMKVMFFGKQSRQFFGIKIVGDLRNPENKQQLNRIERCLEDIMNESCYMELCVQSYKLKNRLLYKAIDTVIINDMSTTTT